MESSKLATRLRGILNAPRHTSADPAAHPAWPETTQAPVRARAAVQLEHVLGGRWLQNSCRGCFVVERSVSADAGHGRVRVGDIAARLNASASDAPLLTTAPVRPPLLFFDLETTGLNGGAGTYAFLVGCGWFDRDGSFSTRQYVLTEFAGERSMLEAVAGELASAGALVSFNGKSFDAPMLETRYLYHRLEWKGGRLPHLDVLHPARRFWGNSPNHSASACGSGCSLTSLEYQILGTRRFNDVTGLEIPARYFHFVRSGDARPLATVLEHNRLDLLSLAGLTGRLLHLVGNGPDEACDGREALALGRAYLDAGLERRARDAFARAVELADQTMCIGASGGQAASALIKLEVFRSLAVLERRVRRYDQAATLWQQMLDLPECPAHIAREATTALAVHHEHRVRDLQAARAYALRSLGSEARPAWNDAVRHRLLRIDRKLADGSGFLL